MHYAKASLAAKEALKVAEEELKSLNKQTKQLKAMIHHLRAVSRMKVGNTFVIKLLRYEEEGGGCNRVALVRYLRSVHQWGLKDTIDKLKTSNQQPLVLIESSDIEELTKKFQEIKDWGFDVVITKAGE